MKKRCCVTIIRSLLLLGVMSLLIGSSITAATQASHVSKAKGNSMGITNITEPPPIPPIDAAVPLNFKTASFGLGWFWGIESQFGIINGVIRTRVGYAGGKMASPTYSNIGDHTETVQVDYDPEILNYDQLLDIFWKSHGPSERSMSRQYMKAVFYHNEQQHELAMASQTAVEKKIGSTVRTEVVPIRSFTMAEDYHQKFTLKPHSGLKNEMSKIYPRHQDFVASTAVARLNGYAGGHGTKDQLSKEIDSLGLSAEGKKVLIEMVRR